MTGPALPTPGQAGQRGAGAVDALPILPAPALPLAVVVAPLFRIRVWQKLSSRSVYKYNFEYTTINECRFGE